LDEDIIADFFSYFIYIIKFSLFEMDYIHNFNLEQLAA